MPRKSKKCEHPSYGLIQMSKYQGKDHFFGSSVPHQGGISIRISKAYVQRNLSTDWTYADDTIVEIRLSALQFAELITTGMNSSGTPCTIKYEHSVGIIEDPPFEDKDDLFKEEYAETIKEQVDKIDEALSITSSVLSQKTIKKGQVKEIKRLLELSRQDIVHNMEYVKRCFTDHVQRSVTEAKASVESFIEGRVRSLGVQKLEELCKRTQKRKLKEGE